MVFPTSARPCDFTHERGREKKEERKQRAEERLLAANVKKFAESSYTYNSPQASVPDKNKGD